MTDCLDDNYFETDEDIFLVLMNVFYKHCTTTELI